MAIHLRPTPAASVIPFPNTAAENRDAVIGQLENIQASLVARNGSYLGRQMFIEAAAAVMARAARRVDALDDTRDALLPAFDFEAFGNTLGHAS